MYKNASDLQSFQQRVASHATKGSRTGLVKDLPAWAQEPEEYYRGLAEQLTTLLDEKNALEKQCTDLAFMLRPTLPGKEYDRIKKQSSAYGQKLQQLNERLSHLRPLVRAASLNAWGAVTFHVSRQILDKETYLKLLDEVKAILGRPIQEFSSGGFEKSPEQRQVANKKRGKRRLLKRREHTRKAATNYEIRWERIDGVYKRVVIKNGVRFVDE